MNDSTAVFQNGTNSKESHLITAFQQLNEKINTTVSGQFGYSVIIRTGNVVIDNNNLDCEFTIPFDDDTEANEAEIVIYNLTNSTINEIKTNSYITVTAGYGTDTGIIFSGYISKKAVEYDEYDKVVTIKAVDDMNRKNKDVESISYAAGTRASRILKDLCLRVGLPIAVFSVSRDYTYEDEETIDGDLFDNIKRLAKICGVSAYILKSKIYVRPLNQGDNTTFSLSADTGLLSISPFEEEEKNGDYKDIIRGYNLEMLLQHRLQTASIITVKSKNGSGKYRVKSGEHIYDGSKMITKAKVVTA